MTLFGRRKGVAQLRYRKGAMQVIDMYLPTGEQRGVVALVHGGFWRSMYGREGLGDHCKDLASRGFVVGNVGYRRVGEAGGGWPGTCDDVTSALVELRDVHGPITAVIGHSAGGQLALYASHQVSPLPRVVIPVSGACDLRLAYDMGLGNGAVADFVGGDAAAVALADPAQRLPLTTKAVLITTEVDGVVPPEISASYVAKAVAAGDDAVLQTVPGDHFSILDTKSAVWAAVVAAVESVAVPNVA